MKTTTWIAGRTQFALVADMEKKWSEMETIVNQYR